VALLLCLFHRTDAERRLRGAHVPAAAAAAAARHGNALGGEAREATPLDGVNHAFFVGG